MSFQNPNTYLGQTIHDLTRPEHRFYAAENWTASPRTPPQQTNRSLDENHAHTFGSVADNGRKDKEASFASSLLASPLTTVPRAPTPPSGRTNLDSDDTTTTDDLYGPDRLFGPALVPAAGAAFPSATAQIREPPRLHAGHGPVNVALHGIISHGIAPSETMTALLGAGSATDSPQNSENPAFSNPGQYFKDAIARDAANVTPGVDDTPYILYALDALSGNIPAISSGVGDGTSTQNTSSYSSRHVSDKDRGLDARASVVGSAAAGPAALGSVVMRSTALKSPSLPPPVHSGPDRHYSVMPHVSGIADGHRPSSHPPVSARPGEAPASSNTSLSTLVHSASQLGRPSLQGRQVKDSWIYLDYNRFPPQDRHVFSAPDFKPSILRLPSMIVFISLCILMIAGLVASAVYSKVHNGLTIYNGSIYGGQYFVFRVLPQLLGAVLLVYASSIATATIRIHPFARMADLDQPPSSDRRGPIFDDLYPRSFPWPQAFSTGLWQVCLPLFVIWLMNITVPIQSALFSVILVDGEWYWATVQGVAWTLVVLYIFLAAAAALLLIYWHGRQTGLIWDPRSISDFIALASPSNTRADYRGTELLATHRELQSALSQRGFDKVGYWAWRDGRSADVWHGIGTEQLEAGHPTYQAADCTTGRSSRIKPPRCNEKHSASDGADVEALALSPHSESVRYRYLPWGMRTGHLLVLIATAFLLLLALFIVSFLPSTRVKDGFLPRVNTLPTAGAFSAANFLYSFLPALLGQILSLLFANLDRSLRILQPWAELGKHAGGARPERSILADYAACLPLQSVWHAVCNRHWRVASLSLMATLSSLLPVLTGGMFLALTIPSDGKVRMMPNMVLYGLVLALLVLYFICLVAMLPGRKYFRLPHNVTCIAGILSFCTNDDLAREPAFKNAGSKDVLSKQLGIGLLPVDRSRWILGTGTSGDDRRLGIRRLRRYTELTNRPSGRRAPQMVG